MSRNIQVFEFESAGAILIVVPQRNLMTVRETELRDAYNETYRLLSDDAVQHLVVDFQHLDYFSSTFVGILIRLARKAQSGGGAAVLASMNEEIRGILKQLMLLENPNTDFLWQQKETRQAALEWLHTEYDLP